MEGTRTKHAKRDGNFAAEMRLQTSFIEHGRAYILVLLKNPMNASVLIGNQLVVA